MEKTLSEAKKEIVEAEAECKSSKQALMEWTPEVWKGGINVINAFTKIDSIGKGTKQILVETLKLLSDRL